MATLKYKDPETGEVKRVWAPTGDKVDVSGPISEHNASETAHPDIRAAVSEAESNSKAYTDEKIDAIPTPDVSTQIAEHNADETAHEDIRNVLATRVNPNLLDNWYFGNPVDQRGGYVVPPGTFAVQQNTTETITITTDTYSTVKYIGGGDMPVFDYNGFEYAGTPGSYIRGYCKSGYTIDRWELMTLGSITLCDGCIEVRKHPDYDYCVLRYKTTPNEILKAGAVVTISALTADNQLIAKTGAMLLDAELNVNIPNSSYGSRIAVLHSSAENLIYFDIDAVGEDVVKLKAVKLDFGTQQTLAHQDSSGNWVLNEIPDYGEELLKCIQSKADSTDTYANKVIATTDKVAPAGYGLGGEGIEVTDWNTATKNGFYRDSGGTEEKHSPFISRWSCGYVTNYSETDVFQVAFSKDAPPQSSGYWAMYSKLRVLSGGAWSEWEWVNPPMVLNQEYRTTKRIVGKPVYQKFFSLGSLVVGSNVIAIGENIGTWINIIAITDGYGNDVTNHANVTNVSTENSSIKITLTQASNLLATVEYIKTTD